MKVALLCALAPRPRLLLMDEPFTGMDVMVKDELVRGLLETAGGEEWTVVIASHDLDELEMLADWVGFINAGAMLVSEPMDRLRRARRRDVAARDVPRDCERGSVNANLGSVVMNNGQALHVMAKDARQHKWLLLGFTAFTALTTLGAVRGEGSSMLGSILWMPALVFGGMLIVATLIQGDSPTSITAFWASRPLIHALCSPRRYRSRCWSWSRFRSRGSW